MARRTAQIFVKHGVAVEDGSKVKIFLVCHQIVEVKKLPHEKYL